MAKKAVYVGSSRTSAECVALVEEYIRGCNIPGLQGRFGLDRSKAIDNMFANVRHHAETGHFSDIYVEFAISFGISVTLNVSFDSTFDVRLGEFPVGQGATKTRKFIEFKPVVSLNSPSMNKSLEQASAFVALQAEVVKLGSYINAALRDAACVMFPDKE